MATLPYAVGSLFSPSLHIPNEKRFTVHTVGYGVTIPSFGCRLSSNASFRTSDLSICTPLNGTTIARNCYGAGAVIAEAETANAEAETASAASTEKRPRSRPGEHKGFVEEMRIRAMKLHTKDQSKEGEAAAKAKPLAKWEPSREGYLRFLVDSKLVYDAMEAVVAEAANPMYATFRNTGIERTEALKKDIAWFESEGLPLPEATEEGKFYAKYLTELSEKDPQGFLCHFYNVYFAHSAGGRMIGRKVAEMILDGRELEFYKYEGELSELLSQVKDKINEVSQDWGREQKDRCLDETELSFKYSGQLLRNIMS
eukprot:jgi/Mesen1/7974/ME000422S07127